jgi:tetratricopeptide (TPR) repeat protein
MGYQGKWEEALKLCEEVRNIRTLSFGKLGSQRHRDSITFLEHPDTIDALETLAKTYEGMCDLSQSLILYEMALDLRSALFEPSHPERFSAIFNVASIHVKMENFDKAMSCLHDTWQRTSLSLGDYHHVSLTIRQMLCKTLCKFKQYSECRNHCNDILEGLKQEGRVDTALTIREIARAFMDQHQYEDAEAQLQNSLQIIVSTEGISLTAIEIMIDLGSCYGHMKQFKKAESQAKKTIETGRSILSIDHHVLLKAQVLLAKGYLSTDKYFDAELLVSNLFRKSKTALASNTETWMRLERMLAKSMMGQKRLKDAEIFLKSCIEERKNEHAESTIFLILKKILAEIKHKKKGRSS